MADYRVGLICSVFAEPYRDRDKKPEPFTPADFMPARDKETEETSREQTPEEQFEIIKILNAALGGEFVIN